MLQRVLPLAVLSFLACGQHTFINLTDATAVRGADDRVTVTTRFGREITGPPATITDDCVFAEWVTTEELPDGGRFDFADAGLVADAGVTSAQACHALSATDQLLVPLVLVSEDPVPRSPPTKIIFGVNRGRNDLLGGWLLSP